MRLHLGRSSGWPEVLAPAFPSCFAAERRTLMQLMLKVVSLFGTIVLTLRWKRH